MRPASRPASANCAAFTLFEICIAVFIAVLIILAAVPSISGVIEEQRAKKLFSQFDDLAKQAGTRAVTERRPFVLEWDDDGVTMHPLAPAEGDSAQDTGRVDFGEKLAPDLLLPAALEKDPPRVWTFWPTGTCEPAMITCHVPDASWTATYDALTEQPVFASQ
jgi:type II secretory pathway pseudopilin PulG